jgi:hypothetical protein
MCQFHGYLKPLISTLGKTDSEQDCQQSSNTKTPQQSPIPFDIVQTTTFRRLALLRQTGQQYVVGQIWGDSTNMETQEGTTRNVCYR